MEKSTTILAIVIISVVELCVAIPSVVRQQEEQTEAKTKAGTKEKRLTPRTFLLNSGYYWPSYEESGKTFIRVPYETVYLEPRVLELVNNYINEFNEKSCIRWLPNSANDTHHIIFTSEGNGVFKDLNRCWSFIGRSSPNQHILLNSRCLGLDNEFKLLFNVPHEMMHALGFIHEHQRLDRDCYVTLRDDYVNNSAYSFFTYIDTDVSFPYDIKSVMQYPPYHGEMVSKTGEDLGPEGQSLSEQDWIKLNYMYCGGPHICDLKPEVCESHKELLNTTCYKKNMNSTTPTEM